MRRFLFSFQKRREVTKFVRRGDWSFFGLKDLFSMAALDEDAPLIAVTSRMTEASALVNRVEVKKFPFLLTRIIKKL